jgi:hypothetical protein
LIGAPDLLTANLSSIQSSGTHRFLSSTDRPHSLHRLLSDAPFPRIYVYDTSPLRWIPLTLQIPPYPFVFPVRKASGKVVMPLVGTAREGGPDVTLRYNIRAPPWTLTHAKISPRNQDKCAVREGNDTQYARCPDVQMSRCMVMESWCGSEIYPWH